MSTLSGYYRTKQRYFSILTVSTLSLVIILSGKTASFGQNKFMVYTYDESGDLIEKFKEDSLKILNTLDEKVMKFQSKGFITAHIDTLFISNDSYQAFIYKGEKYLIKHLETTAQQQSILESSGIKLRHIAGKPPDSLYIYNILNALVQHRNNNGFPFAVAQIKIEDISDQGIKAKIYLNDGQAITFDTIMTEGRLVMPQKFYSRLLDIKKDAPYDHDKVIKSAKRLRDLQYLSLREEPTIRFINERAHLYFMPDPRPSSRFDFLIGVLPQVENGVRKISFAVDFTAEMYNSFRQGEYSFIQIKRLMPENLELIMKSTIPYIGGLPVGSHLDFRLFKNANTHIDLFFDGGAQWLFKGFNQLKIFGSYRSSSLIEIDKDRITASGRLPDRLDITYSGAGISLNLLGVDYRFNPTKGYQLDINTVLGNKKIVPNRVITEIPNFENSYDSLKLRTFQIEMDLSGAYYFPISNWATIKTGVVGGLRYNQERLLDNELMRVGGNKVLRGFDEESLLTDFYTYGTMEFRIIFDQNSYFTLPFLDWGYLKLKDNDTLTPVLGLGMGLNIGTKAGLFNLAFAAGRALPNPLDFGRMKVHFGYVNLF